MPKQYIRSVEVREFRNISYAKADFSKEINIIYGENRQGKTNFIEAVWLLSGGKSFRGTKDRDMIGFGKEQFRIEGIVRGAGGDEKITVACSNKNPKFQSRMAKLGTGDFLAPGKIVGNFYCVIFSPVHLNIVSGGPALRRKFIDACLCQMYPGFVDNYRKYNHALELRNKFLKNYVMYDDDHRQVMFETADRALARAGYEICKSRKEFCRYVSQRAKYYYDKISMGKEELSLVYKPTGESRQEIYDILSRQRKRDVAAGHTVNGIHREDLDIFLNRVPAKEYASQGQQRSIVIALKLAESDIMEEITGIAPVILLDDVLSELDFQRQDYLLNNIKDKQVFITSCDSGRIALSNSKKFYVENGTVTECM